MIEILAPRVVHALGIDQSREMLAVARVNLERAGLSNSIVRLGDMYQLPLADACFDEWCRAAGLMPEPARRLAGDPLTVVIWTAHRRAVPEQMLTTRPQA